MISIVNPSLYEPSNTYNTNNYILNLSFTDTCIDITDNYNCIPSNHIGKNTPHCICNNSSLDFNGKTNFVEFISDKCFTLTSKLAWGGWFLPMKCSKKQYLVYSKNGLTMFIDESNHLCIKLYTHYNCNYKYATYISKNPISINNWNYIVAVYDYIDYEYRINVFINNMCIEGNTCNGLKYPYTKGLNRLYLGYKHENYYYKGMINSFFITNEWINEKLFDNLYVNLSPPLSHWNICNITNNTTLYDIYGVNNGEIFGDVVKLNFGKDDQYVKFNSTTLSDLQKCAFSISLSVYLNKYSCVNSEYVIFSSLVFNKCNGFSITYVKDKTSYIQFKLRLLSKEYIIVSPIPIEISKWNDILVTYNGDNCIQMYHNEKCVGIVNNIISGEHSEIQIPTYLGGDSNKSFPGIINNIKVFNRLITNIEIKKLFIENYL